MRNQVCAAALLSALALPALASSMASLSVDNFQVSLQSLQSGDGPVASMSWDSFAWLTTNSSDRQQLGWEVQHIPGQADFWNVNWQDTPNQIHQSLASELSATSGLGNGQQFISSTGSGLGHITLSHLAQAGNSGNAVAYLNQGFTLGAGTQATFSMVLSGTLSGPGYGGAWAPPAGVSYVGHSIAQVSAEIIVGNLMASSNHVGSSDWQVNAQPYDTAIHAQQIQLTVANSSGTDMHYNLFLDAALSAQEVLTPVPEPSSCILMFSGLLGLAAIARRRVVRGAE